MAQSRSRRDEMCRFLFFDDFSGVSETAAASARGCCLEVPEDLCVTPAASCVNSRERRGGLGF